MLIHAVVFRFAATATQAARAEIRAALAGLPAAIPEVRRYEFGDDAGINPGAGDFAVVAAFDDRAGYEAYRDHPAHVEVITTVIAPVLESRTFCQFEV